jgi:hypothetical protein
MHLARRHRDEAVSGMFLPHLLAYAAAQNGVPLYAWPADLLGPW